MVSIELAQLVSNWTHIHKYLTDIKIAGKYFANNVPVNTVQSSIKYRSEFKELLI